LQNAAKAKVSATANNARQAFDAGLSKMCSSQAPSSSSTSVDDEYLSPQQMRAVMRKRRGQSGACIASTVRSVANFGRRAVRLGGTSPERDQLITNGAQV